MRSRQPRDGVVQISVETKTIDTNTKAVVCPKALDRLLLKTEANMKEIKRGEIYAVDFGTGCGSEQGGIRPSLILQNDIGNKHSPTTIVAAITSRKTKACLLYTSPSPRDRQKSRMPSSA